MKKITRREVLGSIGIAAGTFAVSGCLEAASYDTLEEAEKSTFPWTYAKLDADVTAERAYILTSKGCMYAAFTSIVGQLAEKFGEPYKSFPFDMMVYGRAGIHGWGSLCGALNGAAAAISLFAPSDKRRNLIHELLRWHEKTPLPVYIPKKPELEIEIPPSIANSELCRISRGNWSRSSGRSSILQSSSTFAEESSSLKITIWTWHATLFRVSISGSTTQEGRWKQAAPAG